MQDMKERFNVKVGLSDHSFGEEAALIVAAMEGSMIEKHFIMNRNIGGPDASFSIDSKELSKLVLGVRRVESILGEAVYETDSKNIKNREFARSLFVVEDVKAGDVITEDNVRSIRPGYGLSPKFFMEILGVPFKIDACRGTPLSWDMISRAKK
jgi:pseudaminic acid synthase